MICRHCQQGGCDNVDSLPGEGGGGNPCRTAHRGGAGRLCRHCRLRVRGEGKAFEPSLLLSAASQTSVFARAQATSSTRPPPRWATLEALAARVAALGISRHDPEAFHIAKDDVAKALRRMARELRSSHA